jgi:quinol monooxygenase YgiN
MSRFEPIIYVDHSEVRGGKLKNLKTAMSELVDLVEANEPQLIAYNVYVTEDGKRMTVVHVHRDSASLEFHMKLAAPSFPKFADFIKLTAIDIYGQLNDNLLEQLRNKARLLGNGSVTRHGLHAGFARFVAS